MPLKVTMLYFVIVSLGEVVVMSSAFGKMGILIDQ
jgi:hypothetical protein